MKAASAQLRRIAQILLSQLGGRRFGPSEARLCSFPGVSFRPKATAKRLERVDVEKTLRDLVDEAGRNGLVAWAKPDADWRLVAFSLHGVDVLGPDEGTSKAVAIGRAITDLLDGLDSKAKTLIRNLAKAASDGAASGAASVRLVAGDAPRDDALDRRSAREVVERAAKPYSTVNADEQRGSIARVIDLMAARTELVRSGGTQGGTQPPSGGTPNEKAG